MIEFRLLGPLEVLRDGTALNVAAPRQRSLLAILLAHANELVPADRLADQLWEGHPPATAATALQVHVSRLRKILEAGDAAPRVLVTRDPGYLVRVTVDQLDTLRFEQLLARGRKTLAEGDATDAAAVLDQALALWRGPALGELAELPFARGWAARLEQLRLAAVEERMDASLACGRHPAVVDELEQLVAREPLRERFWAQLMVALYRSGRQAEALRAYGRLRVVLAEELGIEPSPELRRLEEAVLQQDGHLEWGRAREAPSRPDLRVALEDTSHRPSAFVGREQELESLRRWLDRAVAGEGRLVLLRGEPGIGKTGIAEEVAALARARGVPVLWGSAHEDEGGGPFRPWAEALAGWSAHTVPPHRPEVVPELSTLLPAPDPGPALDPDVARLRMFEATTAAVRRAAGAGGAVLVLDDLQWADRPSLLLLQHLAREVHRAPLLVLAIYRDVGLTRDSPIADALGDLARQPATRRLALAGLGPPEVARFIELTTGLPGGPLSGFVHARTNGNPFFVREMVRLLQAESRLAAPGPIDVTTLGIPEGVRDVVRRRCHRLSEGAHRLLATASVLGQEVRVDVLERVSDTSEPVVDLLDEAQAAGLLVEDHGRVGCYRFSHDLVREALYDELSGIRRARLHGKVGAALEDAGAGGRDAPWSELAHHFVLAAAAGGDTGRAVEYSVRAAEEATSSLAYEEAVVHYERGLAVLDRGREASGERRCRLLLGLGDARWRAGDVAGARRTFLDAADTARALPSPELLAEAVLGFGGGLLRAWHATRGAFGDRPGRLLAEALEAVGPGDSALRARLLGLLAEELYYTANDRRREQLSREAVDMARRLGDPGSLALALCSRCLAVWGPDHLDERLAASLEIIGRAEELGDRQLLAIGRQYLFVAQVEEGDMDAAGATLDAYEALAEELRQPLAQWEARRFRAMLALLQGRFEDAERLALEALAIGQSVEEPDAMAVFGVQLAIVRWEQDRLGELETALRGFVEEFSESPVWRAALALLVLELGAEDESRAELERLSEDDFAGLPRNFAWLAGMAMLAQVADRLGDAGRASVLLRLLTPFSDRNIVTGDRQCWGSAAYYLGMLARTTGDLDGAERWFEQALDHNVRMGAAAWAAHTRCDLGALLLARGRPGDEARGEALAREALAAARELGMTRLVRKAESVLADGRVPVASGS
ncbi:MAG TPA: BTAD domain-containing putative transcriptional regulator [Acidimicrobiales bacterium]|nr:BTAD domain-containing putative transcriptional regulator [Acidimicrobiales bacterium]